MLALGRELPGEGRGDALLLEDVRHFVTREQTAPVDPGAEIGRHRDIGGGGDDAAREIAIALADLVHQLAKARLGRRHCRLGSCDFFRNVDRRGLEAAAALPVEESGRSETPEYRFWRRKAFEGLPFMA